MSSVHIPRVLSQRGKSSLEIERENFERAQAASIQKAINSTEVPAKEKHVRVIILGTHHDKSAMLFWSLATKLQLQGNPIVAWKFCHVVHKMLREGHPHVAKDSQRYYGLLAELGKLWRHLKEGYGRLIAFYTKLLMQKLSFQKKNPEIPGNLIIEEDDLDKLCHHDVNNYFELSVDMLDYMDDILGVQAQVFGSLDMSRSNSMTASGQCRLAPLIMGIQESCLLYDYIVRILYKLHSSLSPDTLGGHRDRFYQQYKSLRTFYYNSANLQYFKNLIKVPLLPDEPPNFLRASDLSSHVKPVAVVPDPEPAELETPEVEVTDLLVDTSSVASDPPQLFDVSLTNNGAPSPPMPDERDFMIERLMREINQLKEELSRTRAESEAIMESLRNRIRELEDEVMEMAQIAEDTTQENESLKTTLKAGEKNEAALARLAVVEKVAKGNEDKFKKMKDIYAKLREEHVQLIRTQAETKKQLTTETHAKQELEEKQRSLDQDLHLMKTEKTKVEESLVQSSAETAAQAAAMTSFKDKLQEDQERLETQLKMIEEARTSLQNNLEQTQSNVTTLQNDLDAAKQERETTEDTLKREIVDHKLKMLVSAVDEGQSIIKDAIQQIDNPHHSSMTCTAEYLLDRVTPVVDSLKLLKDSCAKYNTDNQTPDEVIKAICEFSHRIGDSIMLGYATAHQAPIDAGEELIARCKLSGEEGVALLELIKKDLLDQFPGQSDRVEAALKRIMVQAEELLPKVEDIKAEQMGDMVDKEMEETTDAIEQAAARISEMLSHSRQQHSGIQLEVNERILDSCNGLMLAIKALVMKAKVLQSDIVDQKRGASSAKDFYKKHHRWTEGLLSAAKAVGWGANVLVEGADKVVKGEGKFEELVVCSQEIAASTTQLVVASKVKAPRGNPHLQGLALASKDVTQATGQVVASAKTAAQLIEEAETMDFSKLTLHQCKRYEMDTQVRVLELESNLEKERKNLSELRKKHYALAGESEGWDQEDIDKANAAAAH